VEKLKIFMHEEVKLLEEQKPSNYKNICVYFNKGLQYFKNLTKKNQKFEA
jgi:hypothetical protein